MNLTRLDSGSFQAEDDPGEPTTGVRRISITDIECRLLGALCRDRRVLEIGTGLGVSTRAIAETARSLHTIDIDPWVAKNVWPTLPDNVTFAEVWTGGWPYEVIFIDADHTTEAVRADLKLARALSKDTLIVCHDAKMPDVAAALDGDWTLIDTHWGLAVQWV